MEGPRTGTALARAGTCPLAAPTPDKALEGAHKAADDFSGFGAAMFDTVVMNSVVELFPSSEYLTEVIGKALDVVKPGGVIFVGDVRNLAPGGAECALRRTSLRSGPEPGRAVPGERRERDVRDLSPHGAECARSRTSRPLPPWHHICRTPSAACSMRA